MKIDLSKKQKLVYDVIKDNPDAADSDAILLEQVWLREGWDESKSLFWNLSRVTRPETITRRRRELYNLGLIDYSDKAEKDRTEAFNNERDRAQPAAISWLND